MRTITDQIISAGIELGEQIAGNVGNWRAQEQAMREMIAAALADARREGADAMREACEKAVWLTRIESELPDSDDNGVSGWLEVAEDRVRRSPIPMQLPTGKRQAVLLTCDQCGAECTDPWHYSDGDRRHLHACDACGVPERREVLLTDERLDALADEVFDLIQDAPDDDVGDRTWDRMFGRSVQSAVLAANNLEVRRG